MMPMEVQCTAGTLAGRSREPHDLDVRVLALLGIAVLQGGP
jgi:hypothetical protein